MVGSSLGSASLTYRMGNSLHRTDGLQACSAWSFHLTERDAHVVELVNTIDLLLDFPACLASRLHCLAVDEIPSLMLGDVLPEGFLVGHPGNVLLDEGDGAQFPFGSMDLLLLEGGENVVLDLLLKLLG